MRQFAEQGWKEDESEYGDLAFADPWNVMLPLFEQHDVVVVTPAGNDAQTGDPIDYELFTPRRLAMTGRAGERSLIVVGGINKDGSRWHGSNQLVNIITTYGPAESMLVADANSGNFKQEEGTSLATAITSALIATFLDRPDIRGILQEPRKVAANVKQFVKEVAGYHTDTRADGIDHIGTFNYIPCELSGEDGATKIKRQADFDVVTIGRAGQDPVTAEVTYSQTAVRWSALADVAHINPGHLCWDDTKAGGAGCL